MQKRWWICSTYFVTRSVISVLVLILLGIIVFCRFSDVTSGIFKVSTLSPEDREIKDGNMIFFLQMTYPRDSFDSPLDGRQACAVESAAKQNPGRTVYLIYSSPNVKEMPMNDLFFVLLNKYNNVKIVRIDWEEYVRGTAVEKFWKQDKLGNSSYPVENSSNLLRLLTLFKYGGTYLDLDFVVTKDLRGLGRDWVANESPEEVNNAAIDLSLSEVGRNFSKLFLRDFVKNYRDVWGWNGPGVMTRVLKEHCTTQNLTRMNRKFCEGIGVYRPEKLYPITFQEWKRFFDPKEVPVVAEMTKEAYGFHLWNKLSKGEKTSPHLETPYTFLAKNYCPHTYEISKNCF